jgi:hypothetical protein
MNMKVFKYITGRHDNTEILLKVALNTINQPNNTGLTCVFVLLSVFAWTNLVKNNEKET